MSIVRDFLGWDRPALQAATAWLDATFRNGSRWDLSNVAIVLPGSRAERRLLECLVVHAEEQGLQWTPPTLATVGRFFDQIQSAGGRVADEPQRHWLWQQTLMEVAVKEPAKLEPLFPHPPTEFADWMRLARLIDGLAQQLDGENLDFSQVAASLKDSKDSREAKRWEVLSDLAKRYAERTKKMGWTTRSERRQQLLAEGSLAVPWKSVVLLALVDLPLSQRSLIEAIAKGAPGKLTSLVYAPSDRKEDFDALGCLIAERWQEVVVPLQPELWSVEDGPRDQARAAVDAITRLAQHADFHPDEVTIGLLSPELLPFVEQRLDANGLPHRYALGQPIERTPPLRVLQLLRDFLHRRSQRTLAALVREPWVHHRLSYWKKRASASSNERRMGPVQALDRYVQESLDVHLRFDANRHSDRPSTETREDIETAEAGKAGEAVESGEPATLERKSAKPGQAQRVTKAVVERLDRWLTPWKDGQPQFIAIWRERVASLFAHIQGKRRLNRSRADARTLVAAIELLQSHLNQLEELSDSSAPVLDADAFLTLIVSSLEGTMIPPESDASAIEILGWLELLLDDAPNLVLVGMNEGFVPSSVHHDAFLPEQLRKRLNLLSNERRYARDAYALCAMLSSSRQVRIVAGRRTAVGDPLIPSRLLLACEEAELPRRVLDFFHAEHSAPAIEPLTASGVVESRITIPEIRWEQPITGMRVTAFKDYLACPYRFALRHLLKLETQTDEVAELDALHFGSLAHLVVEDFARSECRESTVPEEIFSFLQESLDRLLSERHGAQPPPGVLLQKEQLAHRLRWFANWQAEHFKAGFRILAIESDANRKIDVDGEPFEIRGRIDRIDWNPTSRQLYILDYKSSKKGETPEKTHYKHGDWTDLQLPLYWHMVSHHLDHIDDWEGLKVVDQGVFEHLRNHSPQEVTVGYLLLPQARPNSCLALAEWDANALHEALDVAHQVIRKLRAGEFLLNPDASGFPEFDGICQIGALGNLKEKEGESAVEREGEEEGEA